MRTVAPAAGLLLAGTATAVLTACSTTSGSPPPATHSVTHSVHVTVPSSAPSVPSVALSNLPSNLPSALPSLPTSLPSVGRGSGANSAMCQDFRKAGGRLSNLQKNGKYGVRLWRQLAKDAPPAIKPDAQAVARFVTDAAHGHPNIGNVAKVMTSLRKVADWATKNCI